MGAPGRAHLLGGASPLRVRQGGGTPSNATRMTATCTSQAARRPSTPSSGDRRDAQPAPARLDELLQVRPGQGRVAGVGRLDETQTAVPNMTLREATERPRQDADEARIDRGARVALGDRRRSAWWNAEASHVNLVPEILLRPHGAGVVGGYPPALPGSIMNRRMRSRTYGGVGGRGGGDPAS